MGTAVFSKSNESSRLGVGLGLRSAFGLLRYTSLLNPRLTKQKSFSEAVWYGKSYWGHSAWVIEEGLIGDW